MSNKRLSFTVGPVQTFVAQARRTRDLWAGSWLLSYLTEHALRAAEQQGGQAIIPHRDSTSVGQITSVNSAIGGIPNRFEVAFGDHATAKAAAQAATRAFQAAWNSIAMMIFDKYVRSVLSHGHKTEEIWNRQVQSFWELSWIITDEPGPTELAGKELALRKMLRNVSATVEEGTKCSIVTTLQEISGHYGHNNWSKQQSFWEALRNNVQELDLRPDEKLCAVALIKRMYPEVIETHLLSAGHSPGSDLQPQSRWPSLGFFAAFPWLAKVNANPQARKLAEQLNDAATRKLQLKATSEELFWRSEQTPAQDFGVPWATADAPVWHPGGLEESRVSLLKGNRDDKQAKEIVQTHLQLLNDLQTKLFHAIESRPLPFYALLKADGDSMGKLLSALKSPTKLSQLLDNFAKSVREIIRPDHPSIQGRVVFAGGDDVMALVTAPTALSAAYELSQAYRRAFEGSGADAQATLSVSVVYAHWKHPLKSTIATAHRLLDSVAKESTGRDALALGLIQGCGLSAIWSVPWQDDHGQPLGTEAMNALVDRFTLAVDDEEADYESFDRNDTREQLPKFNSSYLYTLRHQFSRLLPRSLERPGVFQRTPWEESDVLFQLAHAEYRRRMSRKQQARVGPELTSMEIERLMRVSRHWERVESGNESPESRSASNAFGFDGWKIARFLKQVREGKLADHD